MRAARRAGKRMPRKDSAYFMISVVARRFDVHPQTLRLYEREGFLKPSRTEGNTRLYSEGDLEKLSFVLSLTRDLGVNLAGVEIIMNMRRRLQAMQGELDRFLASLKDELQRRGQREESGGTEALVKAETPGRVIKIQKG